MGDWFSTKSVIYDFWILKVPFFTHFHNILIFESEKVIDTFILTCLLSYLSQSFTSW